MLLSVTPAESSPWRSSLQLIDAHISPITDHHGKACRTPQRDRKDRGLRHRPDCHQAPPNAPHRPAHYAPDNSIVSRTATSSPQFRLGVSHGRWRIRHRSPSAVGFRHAAWDPTTRTNLRSFGTSRPPVGADPGSLPDMPAVHEHRPLPPPARRGVAAAKKWISRCPGKTVRHDGQAD